MYQGKFRSCSYAPTECRMQLENVEKRSTLVKEFEMREWRRTTDELAK